MAPLVVGAFPYEQQPSQPQAVFPVLQNSAFVPVFMHHVFSVQLPTEQVFA
jgi:hypothetical protein